MKRRDVGPPDWVAEAFAREREAYGQTQPSCNKPADAVQPPTGMSDQAKVDFLRANHATEGTWDGDKLTSIKLGHLPDSPTTAADQVKSRTPAEAERHARAEQRRIALAASGGPVRRLGVEE